MDDLRESLQSYFASGEFSDLTIRTETKEFKVHKVVVCSQSEFFSGQNLDAGTIDLGDDPEIIEAMLQFMYGLEYNTPSDSSAMLFHYTVYRTADFYDAWSLKKHLIKNLEAAAKGPTWQPDDLMEILEEVFKEKDEFEGTMALALDEDLGECLIRVCHEHIDDLVEYDGFEETIQDQGMFASRLLMEVARHKKR